MDRIDEYSSISVFISGVVSSLLILTVLGVVVGFSIEPALQGQHSLFTYIHYVFVVGGVGGVLAIGWAKIARIATVAGSIAVLGIVISSTPENGQSIVRLTSKLGVASVLVPFGVFLEYVVKNPDKVQSALTPEAVRIGLITGAAHAGLIIVARGLLGFYEGGFVSTIFANITSIGVAVWSIGGVFVVGFVAGLLIRRYRLVSPLVSTSLLFATATILTWLRVQPDGPSDAVAIHLITLYSWAWLGTLSIGVGFALLEREILHKRGISANTS